MATLLNAHAQWATRPNDQRFETLSALSNAVKARRDQSRSMDVDIAKIHITAENETIAINRGLARVEPTHWSFGQLATWLKAPASYLRTLPTDLSAPCLNNGLSQQAESGLGSLKFMAIARPGSELNTLQAVTSTTYGRIWDADCVDAVSRIVERSGGKFNNPRAYVNNGQGFSGITGEVKGSGLYASDRDVFMFLVDGGSVLDAGPRAQLNRGFFVWNSEVGSRTFGMTTFLFNVVCGNHIVWGAQDVQELRIRHTQNGPHRFDAEATPALLAYCNASAKPIEDQIRKAQAFGIGKTDEEVTTWIDSHGKFSKSEIRSAIDFAKSEEGDCQTLWHVVQGLTAYSRGFDWIDARIDLETRAGKLLDFAQN